MRYNLAEALRHAVANSGRSLHYISSRTRIPQPTLSRFMAGADLRLSNASKLLWFFTMEVLRPHTPRGRE